MKHLDLFSGIGGAAIAVDAVWPGTEHIFCEIDPYCQALLKLRYPNSKIYGDIRTITAESLQTGRHNPDPNGGGLPRENEIHSAQEGEQAQHLSERCCGATADPDNWRQENQEIKTAGDKQHNRTSTNPAGGESREPSEQERREDISRSGCDILTGGFPCQPFSQAGKRKGTADNRHLWPEMLRVIRLTKPQWVIAENVRGILTIEGGLVFEQVCLDLEASGYEVQPFIIPAVAVNAPHRRDRVWFVAYRTGNDQRDARISERGLARSAGGRDGQISTSDTLGVGKRRSASKERRDEEREMGTAEPERGSVRSESEGCVGNPSHSGCNGHSGRHSEARGTERPGEKRRMLQFTREDWNEIWLEVATELCGVDDGLPAELDGLKLSASRHRVERLKGLGNAWVPQVAIEIMKAIKESSLPQKML